MGTKVSIDGKQVGFVQHIDFSADVNEIFAHINVHVTRMVNGHMKTKKIKVRDPKTQKFVEKEEVEFEPLMLERQQ
jgi:hypothetical protein